MRIGAYFLHFSGRRAGDDYIGGEAAAAVDGCHWVLAFLSIPGSTPLFLSRSLSQIAITPLKRLNFFVEKRAGDGITTVSERVESVDPVLERLKNLKIVWFTP